MTGSGTLLAPYQITDVDDLQDMTVDRTACYILANDIDASGTDDWNTNGDGTYDGFEPIGMQAAAPFSGCLDGNGYKITGIHINKYESTSSLYMSLLGYVKGTSQDCLANGEITGSAASWTLGAQWEYNADTIRLIGNSGGTLSQALVNMTEQFVPGEDYTIRFSTGAITGTIAASAAGVSFGNITPGLIVQFEAVSNTPLVLTPSASARVVVNSINIERVSFVRDLTIENPTIYIEGTGGNAAIVANYFVQDSGMFISSVKVENITITGATITAVCTGNPVIGGAFGILNGIANIDNGGLATNCNISDITISQTGGQISTGGFAVEPAYSMVLTDCSVQGSITTYGTITSNQVRRIGGFVSNLTTYGAKYNHCYANVNITDTVVGTLSAQLGGFCGQEWTQQFDALIANDCVAAGNIYTTHTKIATISGFSPDATATRCAATGNITAKSITSASASGNSVVGGFTNGSGSCVSCYSSGKVLVDGNTQNSVYTKVGGFSGYASNSNFTTCYTRSKVYGGLKTAGAFSGSSRTGTACYFDIGECGYSNAVAGITGDVSGISGKTSAQMQSIYTYIPSGSDSGSWDFDSVWNFTRFTTSSIAPSNLTVWLSRNGDYERNEAGTKDSDAFQLTIPSTNEIRWIESMDSLIIGTSGDEWKIGSNKLGTPLSPTNFGVKRQTNYGSALMQAIRVNEVILFVDYVRRKLREMSYDVSAEKFTCPDMTSLAEHITAGQIKWIAYQRNPDSMLWVGLITGEVKCFVYDREQNVLAWTNFPIGGDAEVQSGCVIPGETEDVVYLTVNRTTVGSFIYSGTEHVLSGIEPVIKGGGDSVLIEKFAPRSFSTISDAFFVDCGVTWETSGADVDQDVYYGTQQVYSGTESVIKTDFDSTAPSSTVTGLDHLEGETVQILADGVVADDAVVTSGEVTIQIGGVTTAALKAQVGLAYTSKLQPMRLVLGDSMGKKTRVNSLVISLLDTGACKYGPDSTDQRDIDLNEVGITNTSEITGLLTGEVEVCQAAGFDPLNPVVITSDAPLPLVVRCIAVDLDKTG